MNPEPLLSKNQVLHMLREIWATQIQEKVVKNLLLIFPDFWEILDKNTTTYLETLKSLSNSELFKHLYLQDSKDSDLYKDITSWWLDSCAYFVSNILVHYGFINEGSATVSSLEYSLRSSQKRKQSTYTSWSIIPPWSIIFRDLLKNNELYSSNAHVWFAIWNSQAISNSSYTKTIQIHPMEWTTWSLIPTRYYSFR